ncbi:hypothetical protein SAMN05444166_5477 [Singulisphaera sp. GP187]|uniref:hypothetical protein n=1 Tax=Singulisphaera sp. GP187 TaxID=1882752 RepID=UPI00092C0145|nr:hypothetical protein [Singulisphaera sp. GP187]SIO57743.1 hypothetical protein SAMN05444166_5477 [Singulisphaera sp. GP187]
MIERFLAFSAEVTAFTEFELRGTGQAEAYLTAVEGVIGGVLLGELLDAYERVPRGSKDKRVSGLRREIFGDEKLGPIARNIIKLWYIGIWYELPHAWTEAFGAIEKNVLFMVSASAYTEGLLWVAIGANPPGAKGPGYGSWVGPPQIEKA